MSATTGLPRLTRARAPERRVGDVVVGRYLVRERVGAGPSGAVYRAEDLLAREDVALRVVSPSLVPDDGARLRFLRDATAARALANRYVGGVRDAFLDDSEGEPACVVIGDFLRQPTLAARVRQRLRHDAPFLPVEVAPIVSQLGIGLSAIHRAGLVHGNLKTSNVFFAGDEVRIGDLGLGAAGARLGRRPAVSDDVEALSTIAAEMLGISGTLDGDQAKDGAGEAARAPDRERDRDLPPAAHATLKRALSRNPRDRFPDIDSLASALLTAFERDHRASGASGATVTPPAASPTTSAARSEDSGVIAGALQVPMREQAKRLRAKTTPSVVLDHNALDSRTPVTAPPAAPDQAATPPLAPLPPARPVVRVPMSLVVALIFAATSLTLVILHRLIDAHFEEQAAIARVEKARVLARLRGDSNRVEAPAAAAPAPAAVLPPVPPPAAAPATAPSAGPTRATAGPRPKRHFRQRRVTP